MASHRGSRRCVLVGDLEPMARLGMTRMLAESGVEVVAGDGRPSSLVDEARRLGPDAVVLALDSDSSRDVRERLAAAAPGAKVILWARDETEMQVFDPGSSAPRRIQTAVSDALLSELSASNAKEGE
jgi:DNA-binding NarL/FixJ family response regulator